MFKDRTGVDPDKLGKEIARVYRSAAKAKFTGTLIFNFAMNSGGVTSIRREMKPSTIEMLHDVKKYPKGSMK